MDHGFQTRTREYNNRPDVREKRIASQRLAYQDPEKRAEKNRKGVERFKANKEKVYAYRRTRPDIYGAEANREYIRNWQRKKRDTDPQYRIGNRLRSRIWHAIQKGGGRKAFKTVELLGCSIAEVRAHLESKFTDGMTWENVGKWHIDHIVPCSSFDLTDPEQQKRCNHYTNLQPLWAWQNLAKSDTVGA
jgi:hypothetical protein